MTGTVKALEWRNFESGWHKADAIFGSGYRIAEYKGMKLPFKLECVGWFDGLDGHYDTLEAAKAAAQADYERRILSALEIEP